MATKAELLALVEQTIAGQGNQVDIGGGLAEVLKNLVNGGPSLTFGFMTKDPVSNKTKTQLAEYLGISEEELEQIGNGEYQFIYDEDDSVTLTMLCNQHSENYFMSIFGYRGTDDGCIVTITWYGGDSQYNFGIDIA